MVKRRRILQIGLGIAAAAALGVWGVDIASEAEIAATVRRRLGFLHLDDAGLHSFAKDYISALLAKRPSWYRWKYHIQSFFRKPGARWGISTDTRSRRERLADNLATLYLLSSDLFSKGADESRTIQYVSLYDPMRACGSPFARPATDAETTG
ncbi:MAG TPA: hypothetical protein VKG63_19520 [Steroidobacteraceae bacterium]|nr:hypothetical protein [Steroidobacteraceae bacterium]